MLKVEVWYHKDGDHLAVVDVPWWTDIYEKVIANRICPCCGVSGWICSKSEKVQVLFYQAWNKLLQYTHNKRKKLYEVPIENGCVVSQAIWPKRERDTCFRDDCDNCWDVGDDAFRHTPK
jgi:hypothetical protein